MLTNIEGRKYIPNVVHVSGTFHFAMYTVQESHVVVQVQSSKHSLQRLRITEKSSLDIEQTV